MKKFILTSLLPLALLSACGGSNSAEIDALRADVNALKLEVFGDPNAICPEDQRLTDISAYEAALGELPSVDLDPEAWHNALSEAANISTLPSGLQYKVVQDGIKNGPTPEGRQRVSVNYHGFFTDGQSFDSSYERGEPISFPVNGVIRGWVEALKGMKACEARILYIPSELAYGENGRSSIPKNATLLFYVQLLEIDQK